MTDKFNPIIEGKRLDYLRQVRDAYNLCCDDAAINWCIAIAHGARNGVKVFYSGEWQGVEPDVEFLNALEAKNDKSPIKI